MKLNQALVYLAKDWDTKFNSGTVKISIGQLIEKLGIALAPAYDSRMKLALVANLIEMYLRQTGGQGNAERFVARFTTENDLLTAINLYALLREFPIPYGDDCFLDNPDTDAKLLLTCSERLDCAQDPHCPESIEKSIYIQEKESIEEAFEIICQWIARRSILYNKSITEQLKLFNRYILKHKDDYTHDQLECMAMILAYAKIA